MAQQKTPHTQTEQNTKPERSDSDVNETSSNADDQIYSNIDGAETGTNRSPRKLQTNGVSRKIEPELTAHEGSVSTRTPKRPVQGITSHSAEEESARQEKVVNDRPDARAGLNRSK